MFKKFLLFSVIALSINAFSQESRILRFPNSSATEVVFSHAGDLYTAPISGGIARKITSSDGIELFPRFSPDGKSIAFTGEYDGNREIYTMNSIGGEPKRITYSMDEQNVAERQGPDKIIMQWTKDGNQILFRSRAKSWNILTGHLNYINKDGGLPVQVEVPKGGFASMNEDGTKMAYNRIFREFRTWKRYSGGQADDIWIYDFKTKQLENISNTKFQDIIPMWYKNKIYYLSDRDFTMNLFCYDLTTKQTKKITNFDNYDVKFPSLGANHIAFENGGYIYLMDLATENVSKLSIQIGDDYPNIRTSIANVKSKISSFDLSPDGKVALFGARGDIFTVPAENGNTKNLIKTPGTHDRNFTLSPDGKWIAFISDRTENDEIYFMRPDGTDITQLTSGANFYRYNLKWSPDSKKILTTDNSRNVYYIDILTKKQTFITKSKLFPINDFVWSPDSKWIAYSQNINLQMSGIMLFSVDKNQIYQVSSELYDANSPEFDANGKYLFFVSDRSFNPTFGNFEYNYVYRNMSNIFGVTLDALTNNPVNNYVVDEIKSDEKSTEPKEKKQKTDKKDKDATEDNSIKVDLNGLMDRIFMVPTSAGNYGSLLSTKANKLYYVKILDGKAPMLCNYDFDEKKENEMIETGSFVISADEKKILFSSNGEYFVTKLSDKLSTKEGKIDLSKLEVTLDKHAEWKQVFDESWRHFKYFFYDSTMHGYDWKALHDKYAELLPYVNHRFDLTYIIGEMIGELDAGHSYVTGGEMIKVKPVGIGLLGADFEFDAKSGFYKISHILKGMNWENEMRSPLTEPGLNIKQGDYIISIDGVDLNATKTPYSELYNKVNQFTQLTINSIPSKEGARIVNVKTIATENDLRYHDWVENNRHKVDSMSNGKIGYVHIPDMMPSNGLNWFVRYFYPQINKEGLVIDDRYNGGGNVSPMVIERLRRILAMVSYGRNNEWLQTKPNAVMTGPLVCLINEQSMSDGDLFPYQFKQMGLGPVIGKRSWGGVVGIYGSLPLLDGSSINRPEVANFSAKGEWVLEDVGMVPDIEVENHPAKEFAGIDEQLIFGVQKVMELVKTATKPKIPQVPPFPNKKKDFGK